MLLCLLARALGIIGLMFRFWNKNKMKVTDHEPNSWFLFEVDGKHLLNVSCSHSFTGYDFKMHLNDEEILSYKEKGRTYLNELARTIDFSSPISKLSTSKYKERYVCDEYSKQTLDAIEKWYKSDSHQ